MVSPEYLAEYSRRFVQVGARTLIARSLDTLQRFGIGRVLIGTGYRAEWFEQLARFNCVYNLQWRCKRHIIYFEYQIILK